MRLPCCFISLLVVAQVIAPAQPRASASVAQYQVQRLNDTLRLILSQPHCRYHTKTGTIITVWKRAELRGRCYRQVLRTSFTGPIFFASVSVAAGQGALRLLQWRYLDEIPPCSDKTPLRPLPGPEGPEFGYATWDVRYRLWTDLVTADLEALPSRDERVGFVGGYHPDQEQIYHLLPYWLAREQARVKRTRRLPPTQLLNRYLDLSRDTATVYGGLLGRPYRPLLVRLLHAYESCSASQATKHRLRQTRQMLERIDK